MNAETMIVAGVVLVVAAAVASVALVRRRRRVWQRFAARHGLRYERHGAPHVEGHVDGRSVELKIEERGGSDAAELGAQTSYLSVTLGDTPPQHTTVLETGAALRALHETLESDVVETGDARMDARFTIHSKSRPQAIEWLNDARREALLELAGRDEKTLVRLDGPRLTIETRTLISDEDELERSLARLLACARRLDDAGRVQADLTPRRASDAGGSRRNRAGGAHR